jgi:serine-type D-Ala-D-Ala carboxypeptidase/endopeptidase
MLGWRLRGPLEQYAYSNVGMGLLGHVLTLKAEKTYQELLMERICAPLGRHDTRPNPSADLLARLAPPYAERYRMVR